MTTEPKADAATVTLAALSRLDPRTPLFVKDVAAVFGLCTKSILNAMRNNDFPPPFQWRGKYAWTAEAILAFFGGMGDAATAEAAAGKAKRKSG